MQLITDPFSVPSSRPLYTQSEDHLLPRQHLETVTCTSCRGCQNLSDGAFCLRCSTQFASYFCQDCGIANSDVPMEGYFHCSACGICRVGSRGEFFHCHGCGCCLRRLYAGVSFVMCVVPNRLHKLSSAARSYQACVHNQQAQLPESDLCPAVLLLLLPVGTCLHCHVPNCAVLQNHVCRPAALDAPCPICLEGPMFGSQQAADMLPCGHMAHKACIDSSSAPLGSICRACNATAARASLMASAQVADGRAGPSSSSSNSASRTWSGPEAAPAAANTVGNMGRCCGGDDGGYTRTSSRNSSSAYVSDLLEVLGDGVEPAEATDVAQLVEELMDVELLPLRKVMVSTGWWCGVAGSYEYPLTRPVEFD